MKPPSKGFSRELQVGIFIIIGCLIIAAFSFKITDSPIFRQGVKVTAYLNDATGLFKRSKVKMSGIDIGIITDISLYEGRARLNLLIDRGIEIPVSAKVVPRPLGILGDKYLEIQLPEVKAEGYIKDESPHEKAADKPGESPQKSEKGSGDGKSSNSDSKASGGTTSWWKHLELIPSATAQTLEPTANDPSGSTPAPKPKSVTIRDGQVMKSVDSAATLDDLTRQLADIGKDLKSISATFRRLVEGDGAAVVNSPVGRTVHNTELLTENLNKVVAENRVSIGEAVNALSKTAKKLEATFNSVDQKKLSKDLQALSTAAGNLGDSVQRVQSIMKKVDEGQGTIGKLVNDSGTLDEINRVLHSINNIVDRARRVVIQVDVHPEFLMASKKTRTQIGVGLFPKNDFGYLAGLAIDPRGTIEKTITSTQVDGGPISVTEKIKNNRISYRFNFQFFKKLEPLAFRLGLFENTGGFGTDLFMLNDRLKLSADLFDFSRDGRNPNLRLSARLGFLQHFYVVVGGDELFNPSSAAPPEQAFGRSAYVGLGLTFVDDDLSVLSILPGI